MLEKPLNNSKKKKSKNIKKSYRTEHFLFFTIDNNFEMVLITWRSSKRGKKKREREREARLVVRERCPRPNCLAPCWRRRQRHHQRTHIALYAGQSVSFAFFFLSFSCLEIAKRGRRQRCLLIVV